MAQPLFCFAHHFWTLELSEDKKLLQPKMMLLIDITVSIVLLIFLFHICECAEGKAEFENAFAVLDAIKPAFPSTITLEEINRSTATLPEQVVLEYMVTPASSSSPISDDHLNALKEAIKVAYTNNNSNRKAYLWDILDKMESGLKDFFEANPENHERQHLFRNTILFDGEDTQNDTEEQDLTARIQKYLERTLFDDYAYDLISVYILFPVNNKVHKLPTFFSVPFGAVDEEQLVIRYHLMRDVKVPAVQDRPDEYFLGMYVREDLLLWKHQQDPQLAWESTLYNELKSVPLAVDPEEMDKAIALHSFEKLLGFLRDPLIKAILKPLADRIIRARSSSMAPLDLWTTLIERILTEGDVDDEHDTKLKQDFITIKHSHGASFMKLYRSFASDALRKLQEHDRNVQSRPNFSIYKTFYCDKWPEDFHVPSSPYLSNSEQFSEINVSRCSNLFAVRTFVRLEEITDIKEGRDIEDSPPIEIRNRYGSAYLLGHWIINASIRLSFYGKQSFVEDLRREQPAIVRFIGLDRIENKIIMPDVNEEEQNDVVEDAKDEYEQPLIAVKPIVLPTGDEKITSVDKRLQMIEKEIDETDSEKPLTEEREKKRSARQNRKDKSPKNSKNTHSKIALTTGVVFVILLTLFILVTWYSVIKRNEQKQDQTDSLEHQ